MHVLVPLGPGVNFDAAKLLCELFGELIVARHPQLCTLERRVDKRQGKALIDMEDRPFAHDRGAVLGARGTGHVSTRSWEEVHGPPIPRLTL